MSFSGDMMMLGLFSVAMPFCDVFHLIVVIEAETSWERRFSSATLCRVWAMSLVPISIDILATREKAHKERYSFRTAELSLWRCIGYTKPLFQLGILRPQPLYLGEQSLVCRFVNHCIASNPRNHHQFLKFVSGLLTSLYVVVLYFYLLL